jgi:hypothetical protein
MDLRPYIRGTLWAGGLLVIGLVIAGSLWLILGFAGDAAGSQAAKGVALVALVGFVLDVLTLNVLLALAELTRDESQPPPQPAAPPTDKNL